METKINQRKTKSNKSGTLGERIFSGLLPIILLTVVLGAPSYDIFVRAPHKMRREAQEACSVTGYQFPENVHSVSRLDKNNDGIDDYTLKLKDKSELVYLSQFQGYKLSEGQK